MPQKVNLGQREIETIQEVKYFNKYLMNADYRKAIRSQSNFSGKRDPCLEN